MDEMMSGFGGMSFFKGGDPFANDPFFQDSGFGGGSMFKEADAMMNKMRKQMSDMPRPEQLGKGQFMQQTFKQTTKTDKHGRPVNEVY